MRFYNQGDLHNDTVVHKIRFVENEHTHTLTNLIFVFGAFINILWNGNANASVHIMIVTLT